MFCSLNFLFFGWLIDIFSIKIFSKVGHVTMFSLKTRKIFILSVGWKGMFLFSSQFTRKMHLIENFRVNCLELIIFYASSILAIKYTLNVHKLHVVNKNNMSIPINSIRVSSPSRIIEKTTRLHQMRIEDIKLYVISRSKMRGHNHA